MASAGSEGDGGRATTRAALTLATFNIRNGRALSDGWNIWWLRRPATARAIADFDADVAGLQEVYDFQLRYLLGRLRAYRHVGVGRNDGASGGEHAPVLYRTDRIELQATETRWLSDTPTVAGSKTWGNKSPRIVTFAWLRHRATGSEFGVANSHYDTGSPEFRRRSSEAVLERLGSEGARPWVVMGDFNATVEEPALQVLLGAGYQDVLGHLPPSGPGAGTEHGFTGATDRRRIDYILVGAGMRVTSAQIVHTRPGGRLPSDHWPVVARLER